MASGVTLPSHWDWDTIKSPDCMLYLSTITPKPKLQMMVYDFVHLRKYSFPDNLFEKDIEGKALRMYDNIAAFRAQGQVLDQVWPLYEPTEFHNMPLVIGPNKKNLIPTIDNTIISNKDILIYILNNQGTFPQVTDVQKPNSKDANVLNAFNQYMTQQPAHEPVLTEEEQKRILLKYILNPRP